MHVFALTDQHRGQWLEINDAGVITAEHTITDLTACPKISSDDNLVILYPGEKVTMTSVTLPKMRHTEQTVAVAYALEEQLASDPDSLYVALGDKQAGGSIAVAVCDQQTFETDFNSWREHELFPCCVLPAFLAIPWKENTWTVVAQDNISLIRTGLQQGFSVDTRNLILFLQLLWEKNKTHLPERILCWQKNQILNTTALDKLHLPLELQDASQKMIFDIKALSEKPPFNLLQGKYRAKSPASQLKKNWQICGIAAITLGIFIFFGHLTEWIYFKHQSHALQTKITATYRELFPGAAEVLEPHFRVQHLLQSFHGASQNNTLFRLLSDAGDTLLRTPTITLQSLQFQQHSLQLSIQTTTMDNLTQWIQELHNKGLTVQQHLQKTAPHTIIADITIRETS